MKTIKFESITLRPLQSSDGVEIFNAIDQQRDYLGKWLPFVTYTNSAEFTQGFVDSIINLPIERSEPTFTIRKGDLLIGLIGFKATDRGNHKTEIGYWLSEAYQGEGIVTRSTRELCKYAFEEMSINRIQIKCAIGNSPSRAIPRRLGFTFEGIERAGELFPDGSYADLEVYSLLRKEFFEQS